MFLLQSTHMYGRKARLLLSLRPLSTPGAVLCPLHTSSSQPSCPPPLPLFMYDSPVHSTTVTSFFI